MNRNSTILLIVEGSTDEVKLINKLFEIYNIKVTERQIYCYNTNIYDLYEKVFKDSLDELDDIDFLLTLKEKGSNREQSEILFKHRYTDIILLFDYEPQDQRFNIDKISVLMRYFSESTDKGMLYINYPCLESYKHIRSIPDGNYSSRAYTLDELTDVDTGRYKYKEIVGNESIISDIRKYNKEIFDYLICENVKKAEYIQMGITSSSIEISFSNIDNEELLTAINEVFLRDRTIPILNTFLFFICKYDIKLVNQI